MWNIDLIQIHNIYEKLPTLKGGTYERGREKRKLKR
jgi:hypothetical protein